MDRDSQMEKVKALTVPNNIVSILLKYLSILFQENIEENTFARSWNRTRDLRISETKGYVLTN